MFVKILNFHFSQIPTETVIECDGYNMSPTQDDINVFSLTMHRNNNIVSEWMIDKNVNGVYFMNNEGKTIDSIHRLPKS